MRPPHPSAKRDRNWEIWRRRLNGETFSSIGAAFSISPERVRQITLKCERAVRRILRTDSFPRATKGLRDEILGVEFVFSYETHISEDAKPSRLGFFRDMDDPDCGIYWWIKKESGK